MKLLPTFLRRIGGFTIVELMVTLLVAGILTAMAVPSFNRFVTSSRLASQANDLVYAMHFARSEAIKRNAPLRFCRAAAVDSLDCVAGAGAWEHWIVRTPGAAANGVLRRGVVNLYDGTMSLSSDFTNDTITFGSDGLARTGGNLVNAADNDLQRFRICSSRQSTENIRSLVLGAGSRISTLKESGTC